MSFPNSNLEGNFSTYLFGKSFWHYRDLKSECWTTRLILCKKILNFFICVEVRILCKKLKYVWSSHFPDAITTNMQIGNDSFVFNTRLGVNKYYKIHINFFEINVNICLLCAHRVTTSIILHTRWSNCNNVCYALVVFRFSWLSFFVFWVAVKHVFHITPFRPTS